MADVVVLASRGPRVPDLLSATERFCARDRFEPSTAHAYRQTLMALAGALGNRRVDDIAAEDIEALLASRWGSAAATTSNRHRAALLSFFSYAVDRGWCPTNPVAPVEARRVRRRTEDLRRARPLTRAQLDALWRLDGVRGRDRLLWRMAAETWARADELLGLDIADLDLGRREGVVTGKGGDRELVWWATGTARIITRIIDGRTEGPLFLTSRRPTRPHPVADTCPHTGHVRLSYRQAADIFGEAGRRIDPDGAPWTLHRLRHAGISQAVEAGWNLAQVRAKSRHSSMKSLEPYANPSADSVAAMTAALDPEARRR